MVKDVKKLRSGDILVECAKKAHAENLLCATMLAGVGMKASPHRSLNSSKGVIRTRDLGDLDEEEIASELRDQGVLSIRRITIKKDGNIINTNTYILTFSKPSPPEKLRIRYLSVHVDLFIPNPLHWFKCQRYGHGRDSCKNLPACFLLAANRVMTAQTARGQQNVQTVKVTMWLHRRTVLFGRKKSKSKR